MKYSECDKSKFTKVGAQTKLNSLLEDGTWNKKIAKGRIYPCPFCKWWHITSDIKEGGLIEDYSSFKSVPLKHIDKWKELINKQ